MRTSNRTWFHGAAPSIGGRAGGNFLVGLAVLWLVWASGPPGWGAASAVSVWLKPPTVSIMTGFIYEPKKPYTVQQWMEGLGNRFDAEQWVKDFEAAGANHLVFYDKWIDGLVFHDTQTTRFKTHRDFLRELAPACQRGGLPLVIYFNAVSDGNPEFDQWATLDKQGKPIVFGEAWPTRYQTLHSPFHQKVIAQVRELLTNYGPIHGLWHDIFGERLNTSSPWVASGYQKMFGAPFDRASPVGLAEFNVRTLAAYLDEVDAIRRDRGQGQCLFTANGSGSDFLAGGLWTEWVGRRLDYLFNEGHSFTANDHLARMAWALPKPLDLNLLLNSSWFTPLEDTPPPSHLSEQQAIAATAIAVCQGAGVNWALTPGHAGEFGQDLQRAKAAGAWFRKTEPWLVGARPYAEAGIIPQPVSSAVAIGDALARHGVFSRWVGVTEPLNQFPALVLPAGSRLVPAQVRDIRQYVEAGGRLIAFERSGRLDAVLGLQFKEEIQGLDASGHNWASARLEPVPVSGVAADFGRSFAPQAWPPRAVVAEPTTAEVLAVFDLPGKPPALLCNRFGRGQALWVAATDETLRDCPPFWAGLCRWLIGEPTLAVNEEAARRYRFLLTRVANAQVLHVIDSQSGVSGPVELSLAAKRLGRPQSAMLAGSATPLPLVQAGERLCFTVRPDPVASVVLKGAQP